MSPILSHALAALGGGFIAVMLMCWAGDKRRLIP